MPFAVTAVLAFVLLALPFVYFALRAQHLKPFRTMAAFWRVLASVSGTHVEAINDRESVLVSIR